jgi:hypothetical protein
LSEIATETPTSTQGKEDHEITKKSSIAAKKGSDEIKVFKAEQAARKAAELKIKKEDDGDEWDERVDPDGDDAAPVEDVDVMKTEVARPPRVNSDYLPLLWKGRLEYVRSHPLTQQVLVLITMSIGMFKHIFKILQPTYFHLSILPHCIHTRTQISIETPNSARAPHQEPPR